MDDSERLANIKLELFEQKAGEVEIKLSKSD